MRSTGLRITINNDIYDSQYKSITVAELGKLPFCVGMEDYGFQDAIAPPDR
jgi:hypothetical protein